MNTDLITEGPKIFDPDLLVRNIFILLNIQTFIVKKIILVLPHIT